jgi:hypothetical protein
VEVKYLWDQIALRTKHDEVIPSIKKMLLATGCIEYIKPLYSVWYEFNKKDAKSFFDKNKNLYHPVTQKNVAFVFK